MKRITTIALCLLASLVAAGTASAQDNAARAAVPFGFYVGNTWVPAGTYTLSSETRSPEVIFIRNADNKIALMNVGHAAEKKSDAHALVFKKYGDKYFLREIRCSACRLNIAFSSSKREKAAQTQEASIAPPSDVYLALK